MEPDDLGTVSDKSQAKGKAKYQAASDKCVVKCGSLGI